MHLKLLSLLCSHLHHDGGVDALEPIAKILKEGSTKVREQVARIFFNISTSSHRKSIIGNFVAMLALGTLLGNENLQVHQLATNTLNNLFLGRSTDISLGT